MEDFSTTTNLHQEEPPLPFKVEYLWKEGGKTFDRLAFCNTLIEDMGVLIPESWDEELAGIQFEADYKIRIGFVKDRSGPGPKTKHIVWALERLFNIIVERNRYSTGTIIVNSNWDTGRLALGTVTVVDSRLVLVNTTNRLPDSLSSSPLEGSTVSTAMTDLNDTVPFPNLQLPNHTQGKSTTVQTSSANRTLTTDGDVHLILLYRQSGATFHDVQVYNASLQLLVRIAEVENQQAFIWPVLSTYNDMDDFTLSIRPLEFAKLSELSWQDTSLVLTDLAVQMSEEEPGGRWVELQGRIEVDGIYKGVLCIEKGDRTGWEPMDLCGGADPYGGGSSDGVATA